jgi:hypothetical protein
MAFGKVILPFAVTTDSIDPAFLISVSIMEIAVSPVPTVPRALSLLLAPSEISQYRSR